MAIAQPWVVSGGGPQQRQHLLRRSSWLVSLVVVGHLMLALGMYGIYSHRGPAVGNGATAGATGGDARGLSSIKYEALSFPVEPRARPSRGTTTQVQPGSSASASTATALRGSRADAVAPIPAPTLNFGQRLEAVGVPALDYRGGAALVPTLPPLPVPSAAEMPALGASTEAAAVVLREAVEVQEEEEEAAAAVDCVSLDPDAATLETRLQAVVAALLPQKKAPVTWTVATAAYAEMFDESWAMMERVGLAGQFFVVCLDRGCARHHCARGRPHLLLVDEEGDDDDDDTAASAPLANVTVTAAHEALASAVALGKFEIAAALTRLGHDFLFLELDVWLRQNPMPLFAAPEDKGTDVFIGPHLNNPWSLNIGVYFVAASPRTAELFDGLVQLVADNPRVHDQVLMNCVLRNNASMVPDLPYAMRPCEIRVPGTRDPIELATRPTARRAVDAAYRVRALDPLQVINAASFDLYPQTVAVHVLSSVPLASRVGKINVAREWLLYEGANGYYDVSPDSRFLVHDGPLYGTMLARGYREHKTLATYLLHLVALARATGRVLVLPQILHVERYLPAWTMIDTATLEGEEDGGAGVQWRPMRFFEKAAFHPSLMQHPEEELEMAQVRVARRDGVVGVRTGVTLARAEAWRRRERELAARGGALASREEFRGDGEERWYRLDERDAMVHLGQVVELLNTDERLRHVPVLRVSWDMASMSWSSLPTPPEVEALRQLVHVCDQDERKHYSMRRRDIDPASMDCHERRMLAARRAAKAKEEQEATLIQQQQQQQEEGEGGKRV